MFDKLTNDNRGQLLLEILIVVGILAVVGALVSQLIIVSMRASKASNESNVAMALSREIVESVTAISFQNWLSIYGLDKDGSKYHTATTTTSWSIIPGVETVKFNDLEYARYFTVENVSRDLNKLIESGYVAGHDDPSTQKLTVFVGYNGATTTVFQYLTRWRNKTCVQTGWSGTGSGTTTCPSTLYESKDKIDTTVTPGSLKLEAY